MSKTICSVIQQFILSQIAFYLFSSDGVSDGQFTEVLDVEMTAIRAAMKRVYGQKPPALVTFVIVQKRHHTRFFPTSPQFSDGKNRNIMPGTVVDKDIVHPFQYQFFLASHAAIQGVTKPSKYCVLVNESKISPDDLQAITYGKKKIAVKWKKYLKLYFLCRFVSSLHTMQPISFVSSADLLCSSCCSSWQILLVGSRLEHEQLATRIQYPSDSSRIYEQLSNVFRLKLFKRD